MTKILCVDDDVYLVDLLRYGFAREGFEVATAETGREALRLLRAGRFDLVVLDVTIPDMNGFRVLETLRAFSAVPVVMLTARAQDEDVIAGFQAGADDYVAKPFSMQVFVTRVKAVLRRSSARAASNGRGGESGVTYRVARMTLEAEAHELVADDGARVRLTPTEGRILQLLAAHAGQVLSGERIMERIWGYNSDSDIAVVKTHIRHLREKMLRLPGGPRPIRTVPGVGYMLVADGEGETGEAEEGDGCPQSVRTPA